MQKRTERDEKTLDIGTALGCLVLVLVAGHVVLLIADRFVGWSGEVSHTLSMTIVAAACITAVAYLVRAARRRAAISVVMPEDF